MIDGGIGTWLVEEFNGSSGTCIVCRLELLLGTSLGSPSLISRGWAKIIWTGIFKAGGYIFNLRAPMHENKLFTMTSSLK